MTAARRLGRDFTADVLGCSRLMGEDEAGTAWGPSVIGTDAGKPLLLAWF